MRSGGRGAPRPAAGARGQGGQGGQGDQVMERRSSPGAPSVHIHPMIQPQVPPSALALPRVQRLGSAGRSLLCWASAPLICPQPAHCPGRPCSSQPLLSSGQLRLYAPALQSQGSWGLCVCVCVVGGRVECILTTKQGVSCHYHGHWVSTAHSCPQREGPAKKKVGWSTSF